MEEDKFIINCNKCGYHNTVYLQDMDFGINSYERQMGAENEHYASCEISCENCGENLTLDYTAWEYPVGCFNTSNVDVSGGQLTSMFNETELFQERYYDFDEEIGLYLPQQQELITISLNTGIARLILEAEKNSELLNHIDSREFEEFIADLFKRQGFKVELTQKTRDGGRDIIAIRSDLDIKSKYIIECKRYAMSNKVGVELIRQLYGVQQAEGANKSVLVTTSKFTRGAIDFANKEHTQWHMDLKDYNALVEWVKSVYGNNFQQIF